MKKLRFILLSFILYSCSNNLPVKRITSASKPPYVIVSINEYDANRGVCQYYLDNKHDFLGIDNTPIILDSIGKFNIGDTVYIDLIK